MITGKENALIKSHKTDEQPFFGKGSDKDNKYWMALLRQALVAGYLKKDIETYGVIKLNDSGLDFISKLRPVEYRWDYREDYFTDSEITTENTDGEHNRNIQLCCSFYEQQA